MNRLVVLSTAVAVWVLSAPAVAPAQETETAPPAPEGTTAPAMQAPAPAPAPAPVPAAAAPALPAILARYYDGESLEVTWQTRPEDIDAVLPAPLERSGPPVVTLTVTRWPKVEFQSDFARGTEGYTLCVLGVACRYQEEEGWYPVALLEDDDIAIFTGRELLGYPKKVGTIHLERDGRTVTAWGERRGKRLFDITATLDEEMPELPPKTERLRPLDGELTPDSTWVLRGFTVRFHLNSATVLDPTKNAFSYGPVLFRQAQVAGPGFTRAGTKVPATVDTFERTESKFDTAWSRFAKGPVMQATYSKGACFTMLSGEDDPSVPIDPIAYRDFVGYFFDQ